MSSFTSRIVTALDVGTSTIRVVIAEATPESPHGFRVLGMGISSSVGVRRGAIVDLEEATAAIGRAVEMASSDANMPIKSVWLSVNGPQTSVSFSRGVVAVSRADGEISPEDVRRAIEAAESFIPKNLNKEVIHIIPRTFKVDTEAGIKDPIGMHGIRLEVDVLIVECNNSFLKNLFKCVEGAGLKVSDYVFAPFAAAEAVLSKRQKELGVMLLDIGGGTASFVIYEEDTLIDAGVIPIGGGHITNDIAIGLKTHVRIAEEIKLAHGSALPEEMGKREVIRLSDFTGGSEKPRHSSAGGGGETIPRRDLAGMIEARARDIFELLQKELKKIQRVRLLPAGIVLIGGVSNMSGISELTRREMELPVEIGSPIGGSEILNPAALSSVTVALGLISWALKSKGSKNTWKPKLPVFFGSIKINGKIVKWLKSFLP